MPRDQHPDVAPLVQHVAPLVQHVAPLVQHVTLHVGPGRLLSQSPNPRPKLVHPPEFQELSQQLLGRLVDDYNAMIDEIEKLSAVLVSVGVDPVAALDWKPPTNGCAPHTAVVDVLRFFEYDHLPPHLQAFSRPLHHLAHAMVARLDGPQLTNGLNRLLEAKDCFVRAALPPRQE